MNQPLSTRDGAASFAGHYCEGFAIYQYHDPLEDGLADAYQALLDRSDAYLTGADREKLAQLIEEGAAWQDCEAWDEPHDCDAEFMQRIETTFLIPLGLI